MDEMRRILPPTCGKTATFRAKLSERPLWSEVYSRFAAGAGSGDWQLYRSPISFHSEAVHSVRHDSHDIEDLTFVVLTSQARGVIQFAGSNFSIGSQQCNGC